ncbi:hypothetical protein RRF57_009306 [Xylaria bambusicola]|uniref:Uncharacterized protein n=1 Tax=Xylaria bambusicola TaxID=326684 RepID=A0AAN7Z8W2_9PEZI
MNVGGTGSTGQCAIFLSELSDGELYTRRSSSLGESTVLTMQVGSVRKDFTISLASLDCTCPMGKTRRGRLLLLKVFDLSVLD